MAAVLILAGLAVGAMGFAIQRGSTCTVAAVDEVLTNERMYRLTAMLEASLWVAGGLALANCCMLPTMPAAYPVGAWVFIGGVLLGFGAWLNGACVFGAIARLGSGEWAYFLTPIGFYVGCLTVARCSSGRAAAGSHGVSGAACERRGGAVVRRLCRVAARAAAGESRWRHRAGRACGGTARLVAACGHRRDRCDFRDHLAAVGCGPTPTCSLNWRAACDEPGLGDCCCWRCMSAR